MLACVQFMVRLQLVHVSVKIDHRLRVGTVHVSDGPEIAIKRQYRFPRKSPFPVVHVKAHLKLSSGLCCFSPEQHGPGDGPKDCCPLQTSGSQGPCELSAG